MMTNPFCRGWRRVGSGLGLLVLSLAVCGCAKPTGKVSGKVLQANGKPLPGGTVAFLSVDGTGNPATGEVDQEGNYHLEKVPVGKVKITVSNLHLKEGGPSGPVGVSSDAKPASGSAPPRPQGGGPRTIPPEVLAKIKQEQNIPDPQPKQNEGKYVPINKKYADAEKTPLDYTVTPGEQTHNIELK
jgi:Carboxypeptidase regulatory-like domain